MHTHGQMRDNNDTNDISNLNLYQFKQKINNNHILNLNT